MRLKRSPFLAALLLGAGHSSLGAHSLQAEGAELAEPAEQPVDAPFGAAWLGAADGDVTLVVFADYACPACREAQTVIDELVAADPKLKVVYRILVNEEEGRQAALTSLAVAQTPGADWRRFHRALDAAGPPTAESLAAAIAQSGIAVDALPKLDPESLTDSPILTELSRNDAFIYLYKGKAIPAWLIGVGPARNGFEAAKLRLAIGRARRRPH